MSPIHVTWPTAEVISSQTLIGDCARVINLIPNQKLKGHEAILSWEDRCLKIIYNWEHELLHYAYVFRRELLCLYLSELFCAVPYLYPNSTRVGFKNCFLEYLILRRRATWWGVDHTSRSLTKHSTNSYLTDISKLRSFENTNVNCLEMRSICDNFARHLYRCHRTLVESFLSAPSTDKSHHLALKKKIFQFFLLIIADIQLY